MSKIIKNVLHIKYLFDTTLSSRCVLEVFMDKVQELISDEMSDKIIQTAERIAHSSGAERQARHYDA